MGTAGGVAGDAHTTTTTTTTTTFDNAKIMRAASGGAQVNRLKIGRK